MGTDSHLRIHKDRLPKEKAKVRWVSGRLICEGGQGQEILRYGWDDMWEGDEDGSPHARGHGMEKGVVCQLSLREMGIGWGLGRRANGGRILAGKREGWVPAFARTTETEEDWSWGTIDSSLRCAMFRMTWGECCARNHRGGTALGMTLWVEGEDHPHPPSSRGQALTFPPEGGREKRGDGSPHARGQRRRSKGGGSRTVPTGDWDWVGWVPASGDLCITTETRSYSRVERLLP